MPPRGVKKGTKRARQYEKIKKSARSRRSLDLSAREEMAARTVNKNRARSGESRTRSRSSTSGSSPLAAGRPALRHQPAQGPDQGAALQPGQAPADRGPLEHEQESVATSGRREKPLSTQFRHAQAGVLSVLSRGSGRAFGDPLLRRPPTYSDASPPPGFSLGAGGRIGRPVSFSPWPSYPALSVNRGIAGEAPAPIRSASWHDLETRLLINGEQVAGDGAPLEVENPTPRRPSPRSGRADAGAASTPRSRPPREAAREWARTPAVDRGELLREVATRLRARTDELAEVMTLEGGKPLVENSDEVGWTAACFDYYAEIGRDSAGRVIPSIESSQLSLVLKEPLGVIGCIVPWNYPLLLLAWKMAPALAAGNALVAKPSELTPLSTLMLAPCLDHLPAGRRQPARRRPGGRGGDRRATRGSTASPSPARSRPARRSPGPASTGWRGSTSRWAARTPSSSAPTSRDRIDVAAKGGAWAAFLNSGQVCTSAERFYVTGGRLRRLPECLRRLHARAW